MNDEADHEGRRTAVIAAALAALVLAIVGAMIWLMDIGSTVTLAPGPAAITNAAASTTTAATAPAPASTTTATPPPTPSFQTSAMPSLPPPEEPTLTAAVPGQSADPDPDAPTTRAPAPAPTAPKAALTTAPAAQSVAHVSLDCNASGRENARVRARLSFTTTGQIRVTLRAGDNQETRAAGPGNVSMGAEGRGARFCLAIIGSQVVGPVAAR